MALSDLEIIVEVIKKFNEKINSLEKKLNDIKISSSPFEILFEGKAAEGETITTTKSIFSDEFESIKFTFETPYNTQVKELSFSKFIPEVEVNTIISNKTHKELEFNSIKITTNKENEKNLTILSVYENQHAYGKFTTNKSDGYLTKIVGIKVIE